jgi:hypothetical protein
MYHYYMYYWYCANDQQVMGNCQIVVHFMLSEYVSLMTGFL